MLMRKMNSKITKKLILGMLSLTFIAVLFLWSYQILFLEENYINQQTEKIKNIVEKLETAYNTLDNQNFQDYLEEKLYINNINFEIIDLDGNLLFLSNQTMGRGMGSRVTRSHNLNQIITEGQKVYIEKHNRLNTEYLSFSKLSKENQLIFTGSVPLEPIDETISILKRQMLYITLILIVLSIVIGVFISKTFIKPIKKINEAVKKLEKGNLKSKVNINTNDEFEELGNNFNNMAIELNKIEELRNKLVSNVSHELRTPLTVIKGYCEMIQDIHGEDKEKRDNSLKVIIDETDRLSLFINNILDLSKLDSGNEEYKYENVSIKELLYSVVEKYKFLASKKSIFLKIISEEDEFMSYIDPGKIEQVFHNIISNSINYTKENGEILIIILNEKDYIKVQIKDNGKGISKNDLKYIWERFYKVECKESKNNNSMGLGLSITKAILDGHSLDFNITSKLNKGTIFTIYFKKNNNFNKF